MRYDVVVVGTGAMGAAATLELARSGAKVLAIDQFESPHKFGSSYGESRITRQACHEGTEYTAFARRTIELCKELEEYSGRNIFLECGYMLLGNDDAEGAPHGIQDPFARVSNIATAAGIEHELLSDNDVRTRFPMFGGVIGEMGYYEPKSGLIRPELMIQTELQLAKQLGAEIHPNETVLNFERQANNVLIRTDKSAYEAETIVIATGPWVRNFLPPKLATEFSITRQVLYWFDVDPDMHDTYSYRNMPTYIWVDGRSDDFYGFPLLENPNDGLKIGWEQYGKKLTSPDQLNREVSQDEIDACYERCIQGHFKGVLRSVKRTAVCMYTDTPDANFVIDWLPDSNQILLVSACSGHGFKHSGGVGKLAADLVLGSRNDLNSPTFGISRLIDS